MTHSNHISGCSLITLNKVGMHGHLQQARPTDSKRVSGPVVILLSTNKQFTDFFFLVFVCLGCSLQQGNNQTVCPFSSLLSRSSHRVHFHCIHKYLWVFLWTSCLARSPSPSYMHIPAVPPLAIQTLCLASHFICKHAPSL